MSSPMENALTGDVGDFQRRKSRWALHLAPLSVLRSSPPAGSVWRWLRKRCVMRRFSFFILSILLFAPLAGRAGNFDVTLFIHYQEIANLRDSDEEIKERAIENAGALCGSIEFILRKNCSLDGGNVAFRAYYIGNVRKYIYSFSLNMKEDSVRISNFIYEGDGLLDGTVHMVYRDKYSSGKVDVDRFKKMFSSVCDGLATAFRRKCELGEIEVKKSKSSDGEITYTSDGLISTKRGVFMHGIIMKSTP